MNVKTNAFKLKGRLLLSVLIQMQYQVSAVADFIRFWCEVFPTKKSVWDKYALYS